MSRWKVPEHFKVIIGGTTYVDCPTILRYKGEDVFDLRRSDRDGFLAINFDLYGPPQGGVSGGARQKLATIRNGQFVGSQPPGYRIDGSADRYAFVEQSSGRVVCEIRFRTDNAELHVSAEMFMRDGTLIRLGSSVTQIDGNVFRGMTIRNCPVAVEVT